jgi:hypothetical protein
MGGCILRADPRIEHGLDDKIKPPAILPTVECRKNIDMEPCAFDLIKSVVIGKAITSAGDFGNYLEFGLDKSFNFGLRENGFHLMSTETPVEDHRL